MARDFRDHRYEPFCRELKNLSINKTNTNRAVLEWDIIGFVSSPQQEFECLCGKKEIKNKYILKNKHNAKCIDVGSRCILHFPDFVVPDDFVEYDDDVDNDDDNDMNDVDDTKYESDNEESDDDDTYRGELFTFKNLIEYGEKQCLVEWEPTTCDTRTYMRLMIDYEEDCSRVTVNKDGTYTIYWNPSYAETNSKMRDIMKQTWTMN